MLPDKRATQRTGRNTNAWLTERLTQPSHRGNNQDERVRVKEPGLGRRSKPIQVLEQTPDQAPTSDIDLLMEKQ